jgi:DNA-binding transcriptional MerR regulator
MTAVVTIGEFSRLTHLSVKALRHYHDIGLLAPAHVDPGTGYRRYGVDQVAQAQLVRRLRDLDLPLAEVVAVVSAPDEQTRNEVIAEHLRRMERELQRTQDVVASLRHLLEVGTVQVAVEHRTIGHLTALVLRAAAVARIDISAWCTESFSTLYRAAHAAGLPPTGPAGASYGPAFFERDLGEVLAYVPVPEAARLRCVGGAGSPAPEIVPGGRFAVGLHVGAFTEFDRTYAAVGAHVAEHDRALPLPIREIYLLGPPEAHDPGEFRTEVCWPILP